MVVLALVVHRRAMRFEVEALDEGRVAVRLAALEWAAPLVDSAVVTQQVMAEAEDGRALVALEDAALSLHVHFLNLTTK